MPAFRRVNIARYVEEIARLDLSPTLEAKLSRLDGRMAFEAAEDQACLIHDGTLVHLTNFKTPAYHVLIDGDLIVNGMVDTNFSDADEGGSFLVTGNITCNIYINHYGKAALIGGDLSARDLLVNAFSDSCLFVGGKLKTKFFFGSDIRAEFGLGAEMEYGFGHCLPLDYQDAESQAVFPRNDPDKSARILRIRNAARRSAWEIADHVRSGAPLFR